MSYANPEITQTEIKCECCGRWFKKITSAHLKLHGHTIPSYKEAYGFCNSQPLEAFYIKQLRQEYEKQYESSKKNLVGNPGTKPFVKGHSGLKGYKLSAQALNKFAENGKKMTGHTEQSLAKMSNSLKERWKDPDYAAKFASHPRHLTPEFRQRMSDQSRQAWSDPALRERVSKLRKEIWNTPEKKQYASERSKRTWEKRKSHALQKMVQSD